MKNLILTTVLLFYFISYSQTDLDFFLDHTFDFLHFEGDDWIELPTGEFDASFHIVQGGNTNNELEVEIGGVCGNGTSATYLFNNDGTLTVLERGATTLGGCNPNEYPQGNQQEGRLFKILTGDFYNNSTNPDTLFYEIAENQQSILIWNFDDEKLLFNKRASAAVNDFSFKENFTYFPNPIKNEFQITSNSIENYTVEFFNILGKSIHSIESNALNLKINTTGFSKGIYIVKISSKTEKFSFKLVK